MLRNRSKKTTFILPAVSIVLSCILAVSVIDTLSAPLPRKTTPNANILLLEGWLDQKAIEMAYNEFINHGYYQIITTGIDIIPHEYCSLPSNGYLIFYPQREKLSDSNVSVHQIEVDCYSKSGGENSSRFNVFVNDSLLSDFTADKKKKKYMVNWKGKLTDIDSVTVQFFNDGIGEHYDRNLYVKEVIIDHRIIVPYKDHSEYDISNLDGKNRLVFNFNSFAELGRNRLISLGIDSSLVTAIPGKRVKLSRTLSSALAFRDWLKTSDIDVKGINIVTSETHARRTMMTYSKILDKKYNIGLIVLPDNRARDSKIYRVFKTIRESIGIVYYCIILLPY
ncbi:MAG: hypothetical protein LLG13_17900 [Bacteroidales bacterium]|nr:hypothetical protein [Bacteroidales bacterium]